MAVKTYAVRGSRVVVARAARAVTATRTVTSRIIGRYNAGPPPSTTGRKATDLVDRRLAYRWFDTMATRIYLPLRYLPDECEECLLTAMPKPGTEEWRLTYTEAIALVRHDDTLNWQKFNNMVVLSAGLLAIFGVAVEHRLRWPAALVAFFGLFAGLLFDFTFQEGMRCLRGHRLRVRALERSAYGVGADFLFKDNPWNHRDALEVGALLTMFLWLTLFLLTVTRVI